jgi:hypothetical protein
MATNMFIPQARTWERWLQPALALLAAVTLMGGWVNQAQAVPSYARQTGSDCASCHVGGYGPQLTPFGVKFKIGGYTDTDGKDGKVPLSAMMVANWTHTARNLPEAPAHFGNNNNSAIQEASLFVAGRLSDNIGAFTQATYSGVDRASSLDQVDVRFAHPLNLGEKEGVFGVSINSNPTLTDPFNTLGQWRFPFTSSDFGFGQGATPLVENLGGGVIGANAYYFWDNKLYAELGAYRSLSRSTLDRINVEDPGKLKRIGSYWRLAYTKDMKRDNFSVGVFGFNAELQPDRGILGAADRYRDLGVDASYQFLGNRKHIVALNASYVREWQKLDFGVRANGAENLKNTLDNFRLAASYHYNQTWGVTGSVFASNGSADAGLYGGVSYNNRPNTSGYILQADWTPWGKEASWGAPWTNVRVGIQYTGYSRFNGGTHYIDDVNGVDRKARDNNTTMLFLWTAI